MQNRKLSGAALASHEAKLAGVRLPLLGAALTNSRAKRLGRRRSEMVGVVGLMARINKEFPVDEPMKIGGRQVLSFEDAVKGHELLDEQTPWDGHFEAENFVLVDHFAGDPCEEDLLRLRDLGDDYPVGEVEDDFEEGFELLALGDERYEEMVAKRRRTDRLIDLRVCGTRREAMIREGLRKIHDGRTESHVSEPARKRRKHDARHGRCGVRTVDQTERVASLERQFVPPEPMIVGPAEPVGLTPDEVAYQQWYEAELGQRTTEYFEALQGLSTAEEVVEKKAAALEDLGVQVPIRGSHGSLANISAAKARVRTATPEELAMPERLAQ